MGNTLMSLLVKLGLDSAELDSGLGTAETKAGASAKKIGGSMVSAGKKMTLGLTLPIIGAGVAAGEFAVDLQESQNAVNVVYGDAAAIIDEYGKTVATTAGLSRAEFNQLGAVTGAFLKNVGFDAAGAAEKTIQLTERASDMASIFNTDVSQALNAIQSGLKGEFNPLEQFGVKLNAAAINARALEMGLADANGELNDSAKATAALALVMEQTEQFAGDFAATSGDLANASKIMKAQFIDTAAALGTQLLPIGLKIVQFISDLVAKFSALTPAQQKTILIIGGIVAAIGPLITIIGGLITAFGAISAFIAGPVGIALGGLILPILAIVAVVALLAAAWKNNWGDIQGKTAVAVAWIKSTVGKFLATIKAWWDQNGAAIKASVSEAWEVVTMIFRSVVFILRSIFNAFKSAFEGDWRAFGGFLREAWTETWELIKRVLKLAWISIKGIVRNLISNVVSFFRNTDWAAVGRSIVIGIGRGLSAMIGWLAGRARAIASAALNAAKGFLGIHSPSAAFGELGKFSAIGFGEAFEKTMKGFQPSMAVAMIGPDLSDVNVPASRIPASVGDPQAGGTSKTVQIETVNINNGMDLQEFEARIRRVLGG